MDVCNLKNEVLDLVLEDAARLWLDTLSPLTKKNYFSGLKVLVKLGSIHPRMNLKEFSLVDHTSVIKKIKENLATTDGILLSEASRQARAACYISLTRYLNRLTNGVVSRASPCRDFGFETFYKVRDTVKKNILSKNQWLIFFEALKNISYRDYLIGKIITQGIRKIGEVISLKKENLFFDQNKIFFSVKKRKGRHRDILITYPKSIMDELKNYTLDRSGFVFISPSGKQVHVNQVYYFFNLSQKNLNLPFRITPDVLRVSALTYLKQLGFSDQDIMRLSGHSSVDTISYYDISRNENISSQLPLIF